MVEFLNIMNGETEKMQFKNKTEYCILTKQKPKLTNAKYKLYLKIQ